MPESSTLTTRLPNHPEIGPLNTRDMGSAVSSRSEAPADKRFGAYWSQNVQLWWQQFLLIFTAKQRKLYLGLIPQMAVPYEEFFSWGSRHHCTIWKSAPMPQCSRVYRILDAKSPRVLSGLSASNHARLLESCIPASQEIIYRLTTENRILKYR